MPSPSLRRKDMETDNKGKKNPTTIKVHGFESQSRLQTNYGKTIVTMVNAGIVSHLACFSVCIVGQLQNNSLLSALGRYV